MAPTYNDPTRGGQPPATAEAAARRLADQLLLATVAASDHAAQARVERRLRQAALRFALAGPREADLAAADVLEELRVECAMESAMTAVVDGGGHTRLRLRAGGDAGRALLEAPGPHLEAAIAESTRSGAAIEVPGGDAATLANAALAAIEAAGVRSLRWTPRRLADGSTLVVALHGTSDTRYWTPLRRQLHEGVADILAAVIGGSRGARGLERVGEREPAS